MLFNLAKRADSKDLRESVFEKITDQTMLTDLAKNAVDHNVRYFAVEKITDQKVLIDIAKNDEQLYVRKAAIKKFTDQTLLLDFAKNDEKTEIREEALKRITDPALWAGLRNEAVYRSLVDNELQLALEQYSTGDYPTREVAIKRLEIVGGQEVVPNLLNACVTDIWRDAVFSLARISVREGIEPFKQIVEYLSNGPVQGKQPAEKALQEALVMAEKGVKAIGGESLIDMTEEVLGERKSSFIDHLSTKFKESSDTEFCNRIIGILKWIGEEEIASQLKINEDEFSYGYYLCFGSADAAKEYYDLIAAQHDTIAELISWRARLELRNKPGVLYPHWVVIYTPYGTLRFFNEEVGLPLEYDDHDEGGQALIKANSTSELIGGLDITGKVTTKEKS